MWNVTYRKVLLMNAKDLTPTHKKSQHIDATLIEMLKELQKSLLIMVETIEYYRKVKGIK
jgi:hypothetical protein